MSIDTKHPSPPVAAGIDAPNTRSAGSDRISTGLAAALLVTWAAALAWVFAITPAPDPAAPIGTLDVVVSLALYGSWAAVATGLAKRRRFGITAGIAAGLMLAAAGLLCLATGHTGMWIAGQILAGCSLAALGGAASRITRDA